MGLPTVSVVIPAYNASGTIRRAVDSVLAQTRRDLEIIVVDDGSGDNLQDVVSSMTGPVELIRQPNSGAGAARNTGVRQARGEFIAFLDADDFWHPRKLELQLAAFRKRPETSLCWTHLQRLPETQVRAGYQIPEIDLPDPHYTGDFATFFSSPYVGTPSVMIPVARFRQLGGFREDLKSAEDIDLWLKAAYDGLVACIPASLTYVVLSDRSLTSLHMDGTYRDNLSVIDSFCKAHPDFVATNLRAIRRVRSAILANWGADAYIKGHMQQARELLLRSLGQRLNFRAALLLSKSLAGR